MKLKMKRLQEEEEILRRLLERNLNKQRRLNEKALIERWGFKKGDWIEWGEKRYCAQIVSIVPFPSDAAEVVYCVKRGDKPFTSFMFKSELPTAKKIEP